jgi:hypothetical protein
MYKTCIRFLRIHIAICVPSLVEIAPGVPELCPDIHTHTHTQTHIHFYRYIYIDIKRVNNSFHVSQDTHYVSVTEANRLTLLRVTVAVYCENHTEHTNLSRISQETHCVSSTEINPLMLLRETVAVYCENDIGHTRAECRFLSVRKQVVHIITTDFKWLSECCFSTSGSENWNSGMWLRFYIAKDDKSDQLRQLE